MTTELEVDMALVCWMVITNERSCRFLDEESIDANMREVSVHTPPPLWSEGAVLHLMLGPGDDTMVTAEYR